MARPFRRRVGALQSGRRHRLFGRGAGGQGRGDLNTFRSGPVPGRTMPLPPSVRRNELHLRRIELRGYRRDDGLLRVEARMVDPKTHELTLADGRVVPAGGPVHDMSIRRVVDEASA